MRYCIWMWTSEVLQNAGRSVPSRMHQVQLHEFDCVEKSSQHLSWVLEEERRKSNTQPECQGSGCITLLIKIRVAFCCPWVQQWDTLDWISWWLPGLCVRVCACFVLKGKREFFPLGFVFRHTETPLRKGLLSKVWRAAMKLVHK